MMRNRRMNLQIAAIYIIIVAALIGSTLLFFYLNTDAMMRAAEAETDLSAAFLASELDALWTGDAEFQSEEQTADRETMLADALSAQLPEVLREADENIDVWVLDSEGRMLYARGGDFPQKIWETADANLRTDGDQGTDGDQETDAEVYWSGRRSVFRLKQEVVLVRSLPESGLSLVMVNHCSGAVATQRQQLALVAGIELILVLAVLMLLTNLIHAHRRQLIQLATTDELTGLANRKSFQHSFRKFTEGQTPPVFSLFLTDVDFFKQINDGYGHAEGDLALQTLAGCIREMTDRYGGFAGRWGGDEFVGVLPLDGPEALKAVNGLCEAVRGKPIDGEIRITVSAGVAPSDGELALARLSERADQALYVSKEGGRNRASLYDPLAAARIDRAHAGAAAVSDAQQAGKAEEPLSDDAAPAAVPEVPLKERIRRYLRERLLVATLNGVRWMAPFVAGGGILIGLAFLFDALSVDLSALPVAERAMFGSITPQAEMLKTIGGATFNFMLPVFAGFMAYTLAGEGAFLAGFVGGYMTIESQSGFIGAMAAGLAAGLMAGQMKQFASRMPVFIQKAAPIVIFPVFNLLLMRALSVLVITPVSTAVGGVFTVLLDRAVSESDVLAGALSGSMMALDMGGIVNKVAYNYAVSGLQDGHTGLMAAVMAGGMVPPIGIALSLLLFKGKYREEERERFAGTLFMGLSFITEGALPFAFSDFFRVIPSCMAGSALAGMLSALYGCTLPAPHGGLFVLPVMGHPLLYAAALAVGSFVTATLLGLWKKQVESAEEKSHENR